MPVELILLVGQDGTLDCGDPKKLRGKLGVGEAQDIKSGHQKAV